MQLAVLVYVVCGALLVHVKATSKEKFKEDITSILIECLAENPVSSTHMETKTTKQLLDDDAAKCFLACAFKKNGVIDDEGKFSVDGARELSKKYFADDDDKMKKSEEFAAACLSVNDEPVSDGAQGCDRAVLLYQCSVKKTPDFDLF